MWHCTSKGWIPELFGLWMVNSVSSFANDDVNLLQMIEWWWNSWLIDPWLQFCQKWKGCPVQPFLTCCLILILLDLMLSAMSGFYIDLWYLLIALLHISFSWYLCDSYITSQSLFLSTTLCKKCCQVRIWSHSWRRNFDTGKSLFPSPLTCGCSWTGSGSSHTTLVAIGGFLTWLSCFLLEGQFCGVQGLQGVFLSFWWSQFWCENWWDGLFPDIRRGWWRCLQGFKWWECLSVGLWNHQDNEDGVCCTDAGKVEEQTPCAQ